jgi:hypothetical protein
LYTDLSLLGNVADPFEIEVNRAVAHAHLSGR